MRLIAGKFRGRTLERPDETLTRPTSDRTRESIFNILMHHSDINLQNATIMDVFAGSGAMGLEALSRGARHAIFVEQHSAVIKVLKKNIETLKGQEETTIIQGDATQKLMHNAHAMDIIFLDPPYDQALEKPALLSLLEGGWLSSQTVIVLETSLVADISNLLENCMLIDQRTYGAAKVSFLKLIP